MTIIKILVIGKDNINAGELLFENMMLSQNHYEKYFMSVSVFSFFYLNQCFIPMFIMVFLSLI